MNASGKVKNAKYLYELIENITDEIREDWIVQVVMNNSIVSPHGSWMIVDCQEITLLLGTMLCTFTIFNVREYIFKDPHIDQII